MRDWSEDRFEPLPNSGAIMTDVDTAALEHAPAVSSDGPEFFFTRMIDALFWRKVTIVHATRQLS